MTLIQSRPPQLRDPGIKHNKIQGCEQQAMYAAPRDPMLMSCSGQNCDLYTLLEANQQAAMDAAVGA